VKLTYIPSVKSGISVEGKKNDCFIRSLVNAFGYEYSTIEEICKKHGRKDDDGIQPQDLISVAVELGLEGLIIGKTRTAFLLNFPNVFMRDETGKTLGTVVKDLYIGRYVVIVEGHAVALENGNPIDTNPLNSKAKVAMILWEKQQFPNFSTKKPETILYLKH